MTDYSPEDGKNYERKCFERYCVSSGDMDVDHGMSNWKLETQDGQVIGFYNDTGQNKDPKGPGTSKYVLNTSGMGLEVFGKGLKVRDEGDTTSVPAKLIHCHRGDYGITCKNGDITLRARNINIIADGGGNKDGQLLIDATRLIDMRAPDVRVNSEKFVVRATQEADVVTSGTLSLFSGIERHSQKAFEGFGNLEKIIKDSSTLTKGMSKIGEELKSITEKVEKTGFADKVNELTDQLKSLPDSDLGKKLKSTAENDELGLQNFAETTGAEIGETLTPQIDRLRGVIGGEIDSILGGLG